MRRRRRRSRIGFLSLSSLSFNLLPSTFLISAITTATASSTMLFQVAANREQSKVKQGESGERRAGKAMVRSMRAERSLCAPPPSPPASRQDEDGWQRAGTAPGRCGPGERQPRGRGAEKRCLSPLSELLVTEGSMLVRESIRASSTGPNPIMLSSAFCTANRPRAV